MMRELSLFSGAGGGLLGTKLLGWTPVGYVEWDEYCQRVLQQRIKDGHLHNAPIFGDIREFNRTFAGAYSGMVDVVTGGFPCQPFSVAGKRAGAGDERNMWPDTLRCIQIVRPKYVFLENVPGLLSARSASCVCGWPDRRGGLHWDTVEQEGRAILRGGNDWDEREGASVIGRGAGGVWRDNNQASSKNKKMGERLEVAYWWGRSTNLFGDDTPLPTFEEEAGGDSPTPEGNIWATWASSQRDKSMDGGGQGAVGGVEERNARSEQKGAKCSRCGRRMVQDNAQFVRYMGTILGDLAESGYGVRWRILSAAEVGAPHVRQRLFIVAHADSEDGDRCGVFCGSKPEEVAKESSFWISEGKQRRIIDGSGVRRVRRLPDSRVCRVVDGDAAGVDRLRAAGNAQVPAVVATAWRLLTEATNA